MGFHPGRSLVIVGFGGPRGTIRVTFRYDLPDPPDPAAAADIAEHAAAVLSGQRIRKAVVIGYGDGVVVTPVAERAAAALRAAGIVPCDVLRVADGRYWSYLCGRPDCCPPEGTPFDALAHPAAAELAVAGHAAYPSRDAMAASIAPVTGVAAEAMRRATDAASQRAWDLVGAEAKRPGAAGRDAGLDGSGAPPRLADAGRAAVREAIARYRSGGRLTDDEEIAFLSVMLADLRVRDDAWARMDPGYCQAHLLLWTDLVRKACPEYVPAVASLLAFTAWQAGNGALANMAIDRALAADPGYSMAHLIYQAVSAGLPPSQARLPMTPEEVEASYDARERIAGRRASRRPSG